MKDSGDDSYERRFAIKTLSVLIVLLIGVVLPHLYQAGRLPGYKPRQSKTTITSHQNKPAEIELPDTTVSSSEASPPTTEAQPPLTYKPLSANKSASPAENIEIISMGTSPEPEGYIDVDFALKDEGGKPTISDGEVSLEIYIYAYLPHDTWIKAYGQTRHINADDYVLREHVPHEGGVYEIRIYYAELSMPKSTKEKYGISDVDAQPFKVAIVFATPEGRTLSAQEEIFGDD
ncbi:MAG: hypothetical protein KGZ93_02200 [Actinobacteria bacterium]|nr:hypothetical protein [Actinomycetota bacterium]